MDMLFWIAIYLLAIAAIVVWIWAAFCIFHCAMLFPRVITFLVVGYILQGYWWVLFGLLAIIGATYDWKMFVAWIEYENKLKNAE